MLGNCATISEFGISDDEMYWAVGVSVTNAAIWLVCRACLTSFSVENTLGWLVGWMLPVMKARLVVPIWSP